MKTIYFFLSIPLVLLGQSVSESTTQWFKEKKYAEAAVYLQSYLSEKPQDTTATELLADAYAYQKKWDEAIKIYKELTQQYPNVAQYWYKYGGAMGLKALEVSKIRAFFMINDIKEALHKASTLDTKHIEVRWALVELYIQLPGLIGGNRSKALKYAEELEQLSKVDGYLAKGYIYEYDGKPKEAESYYKKAVAVGGSLTCYSKLASFYEKENPAQAIKTIEKASEKLNINALNYQLGKVSATYNLELNKGEKCLNKYIANHSIEDGVSVEWAYYNLAKIYRLRNSKKQALLFINKAISLNPELEKFKTEKNVILKMED